MEEEVNHCPEHGTPDDDWPCPTAVEGDPPDAQTCPHLMDELDRRMNDVTVRGNFFRLLPGGDEGAGLFGGVQMVQEYRDHQPYGEPRPL